MASAGLSRLKLWLADQFCSPVVGRYVSALFNGQIPSKGIVIDATQEMIPAEHVACIFFGLYERTETRFARRFLTCGMDVVEIGSGIGVVSAHILTRLGRGDRLICVEANPYLISTLQRNVELNNLRAEVTVLNRALDYSEREELSLAVDSRNLGTHVQHQPGAHVRAISLHDVVRQANLSDYALVCDAEGAEIGMILHDSDGLSRCRLLIIELHQAVHEGCEYSVLDLRRALEMHHGFSMVAARHRVHVFEKPAAL